MESSDLYEEFCDLVLIIFVGNFLFGLMVFFVVLRLEDEYLCVDVVYFLVIIIYFVDLEIVNLLYVDQVMVRLFDMEFNLKGVF